MNKISKVEIIFRPEKFHELKEALNEIGIMGITISNVMGCGVQKGKAESYRGISYTMDTLPKLKLETVVSEVPVDLVIETARKILCTDSIGDGKIFVSEISQVVRIRNNDRGVEALNNSK